METKKLQDKSWRRPLFWGTFAVLMWGVYSVACAPIPTQEPTPEPAPTELTGGVEPTNDASPATDTPPTPEPPPTAPDAPPKEAPHPTEASPTSLTWHKDVQPIIQQNCQTCHSQGGAGPFALTNYEEVKAKGSIVSWSVEKRRMPPWMPDGSDDCLPLDHSRRLTQEQVDTVVNWVKGGMPKGDPKDGTTYTPKQETLDRVDADVDIQTDYTPPASSPDDYHCFLTKPVLRSNKELVGFRFIPGVKPMVHHVLIYSVSQSYANTLTKEHPNKHWGCSTGALFTQKAQAGGSKLIGVWVPGTDVIRFPEGTGMSMSANEHLVLEMHYNTSALSAPQPDRSRIQLQYADQPVKHKLQLTLQAQRKISVPPNTKAVPISNTIKIPTRVRVWGFMPHMHKFATKFDVTFNQPVNEKPCLVNIPRWDYNWQQTYFFKSKEGVIMNRGDSLKMTCTFDNPTGNTIRWGDKTGDEMCLNFYFVSAN